MPPAPRHPGLCPDCGERPPERKLDGHNSGYCKPCKKVRARAYYEANRERVSAKRRDCYDRDRAYADNLRYRFGISIEQYNEMLERQDHVCAACRNPESWTREGTVRKLVVDHDHETGEIRGLLCAACNVALGSIRDRPEVARALADYLEGSGVRLAL